jgi:phosphoribosyl 1,2-cyclic phosphodiesterase
MAERSQIKATIFISHPHWDHINALPFFVPLYLQGNEFEICGPSQGDVSMRDLISAQMDGVYFPIKMKEFSASVSFRDLRQERFQIGEVELQTMLLNHPGYCLGYRMGYRGRSICYVTDNELYPKSSSLYNESYLEGLADFVRNADALITDCTYRDDEYESKVGWGHSAVEQVVDLADRAGVRTLYLFHHDLSQTDDDIDAKLEAAQGALAQRQSMTQCIAPKETQVVKL